MQLIRKIAVEQDKEIRCHVKTFQKIILAYGVNYLLTDAKIKTVQKFNYLGCVVAEECICNRIQKAHKDSQKCMSKTIQSGRKISLRAEKGMLKYYGIHNLKMSMNAGKTPCR